MILSKSRFGTNYSGRVNSARGDYCSVSLYHIPSLRLRRSWDVSRMSTKNGGFEGYKLRLGLSTKGTGLVVDEYLEAKVARSLFDGFAFVCHPG